MNDKLTCDFRYMEIQADIKVLSVMQELVKAVNNLLERVENLENMIYEEADSD